MRVFHTTGVIRQAGLEPGPLLVSHRGLLERAGPLGRAWLAPGGFEPVNALPAT